MSKRSWRPRGGLKVWSFSQLPRLPSCSAWSRWCHGSYSAVPGGGRNSPRDDGTSHDPDGRPGCETTKPVDTWHSLRTKTEVKAVGLTRSLVIRRTQMPQKSRSRWYRVKYLMSLELQRCCFRRRSIFRSTWDIPWQSACHICIDLPAASNVGPWSNSRAFAGSEVSPGEVWGKFVATVGVAYARWSAVKRGEIAIAGITCYTRNTVSWAIWTKV